MDVVRLPAVVFVALTLSGCAALGLSGAAVALSAVGASTGAAVKAGTEYRLTGVAYRSLTTPLADVHEAARSALASMSVPLDRDRQTDEGRWDMRGRARGRKIRVRLDPLTPTLTGIRLSVKRGWFGNDGATASEIIAQIERALESASALPRQPAPGRPEPYCPAR
jgi:hypothetical protein